jgi:hypothetical protein
MAVSHTPFRAVSIFPSGLLYAKCVGFPELGMVQVLDVDGVEYTALVATAAKLFPNNADAKAKQATFQDEFSAILAAANPERDYTNVTTVSVSVHVATVHDPKTLVVTMRPSRPQPLEGAALDAAKTSMTATLQGLVALGAGMGLTPEYIGAAWAAAKMQSAEDKKHPRKKEAENVMLKGMLATGQAGGESGVGKCPVDNGGGNTKDCSQQ